MTISWPGHLAAAPPAGLDPGRMYFFRVRALGTVGLGPWSDIAQKRAS